jgi:hypothetical protein
MIMASLPEDIAREVFIEALADGIVVGAIVALIYSLGALGWRRKARRFFNLGRGTDGRLRVLVSSVFVRKGGTLALESVTEGFSGYALIGSEYDYVQRLAQAIETKPFGQFLGAIAQRLSEDKASPPIVVEVSGSPGYVEGDAIQRPDATISSLLTSRNSVVLVGNALYNSSVEYFLTHAGKQSHFTFFRPDPSEGTDIPYGIAARPYGEAGDTAEFHRHRVADQSSPHVGLYCEYAFLQRAPSSDQWPATVFVCAGTSTAATTAAIEQLGNWRALLSRFGTRPFGVLLEVYTPMRELEPVISGRRPDRWHVREVWTYVD